MKATPWLILAQVLDFAVFSSGCASTAARHRPPHYGVDGWYQYHGHCAYRETTVNFHKSQKPGRSAYEHR